MRRREALQRGFDKIASGIDRMLLRFRISQKLREVVAAQDKSVPESNSASYEIFAIILAVSAIVLSSLFFFTRLLDYGNFPPASYSSPSVYNLTKESVKWDIHYGASLGCPDDACYFNPDTPTTFFKRRAVLPLREFPIKDWHQGEPIFYRARIFIPENIRKGAFKDPISLHTILMFADNWDLYLNQQLVFQGTQETMLAPIPAQYIRADGSIDIAIKANIGDLPFQGIANRGDLVIGPRAELAPMTFFIEIMRPVCNFCIYCRNSRFASSSPCCSYLSEQIGKSAGFYFSASYLALSYSSGLITPVISESPVINPCCWRSLPETIRY